MRIVCFGGSVRCRGLAQYEGAHAFLFEAIGTHSPRDSTYLPDVGAPWRTSLRLLQGGVLSDLLVAFEDNVGEEARLPEPGDPQTERTDMSLKGFVAVFVSAVGVDVYLKMVPIAHF